MFVPGQYRKCRCYPTSICYSLFTRCI